MKPLRDNATSRPRSSESTLGDESADHSTYPLAFAELRRSTALRADGGDSLSRLVSFSSFSEVSSAKTPAEELESPILPIHSLLTFLLACAFPPRLPILLILFCKSWVSSESVSPNWNVQLPGVLMPGASSQHEQTGLL